MSLLKLIVKDVNARKIFGKRELKIIEKQLLGVSLTQSEKNRLSRDIRAKFEFISKAANFKEEFRLKKGAEIRRLIGLSKSIILNDQLNVKAIYLYGSAADNTLTLNSDIDLAVSIGSTDLKESTLFRKRVLGNLPEKIDLQVFEILPENIRKDILRSGKIIYQACGSRKR